MGSRIIHLQEAGEPWRSEMTSRKPWWSDLIHKYRRMARHKLHPKPYPSSLAHLWLYLPPLSTSHRASLQSSLRDKWRWWFFSGTVKTRRRFCRHIDCIMCLFFNHLQCEVNTVYVDQDIMHSVVCEQLTVPDWGWFIRPKCWIITRLCKITFLQLKARLGWLLGWVRILRDPQSALMILNFEQI